ncbi:uncharacterized protein C8Q71DRAFT_776495 [Rhodofomes roseus]|uniref:J domain-containing protein n=1 Tax=Rhodofomes roseus TaxID=34475 RepID=A0ABQ8K758_9APHY|nr:uncharacterized protein C8Q71DRAFT_776495 [Rhodofomes roseus]KAH9832469.1 hypothetical protein C8Q71DRAFT_776495 [Rhodofomes roseus]
MHRAALAQSRRASTSARRGHSFPFPTHAQPTPHQIFHLSVGASQQDIKSRYYDLVRVHHPDSSFSRDLSPEERHARFQSITRAYDILRGVSKESDDEPILREIRRRKQWQEARRNEQMRRRAAELGPEYADPEVEHAPPELRWRDVVIISCAGLAVAFAVAPSFFGPSIADQRHHGAAASLARARREAQEVGDERRKQIRRRVREYREQEERERGEDDDSHSCNWQRKRGA